MKILFTGGGTGGHVLPIIAIVREIRRIYLKKDLEFYYLGPKDEFGLILLAQEDFIIKTIVSGKMRRYFSRSGFSVSQINLATMWQNFVDILFKIPFGVIQSFFMLLSIKPDLIFSKGGSGSISVTYPARILRIPLFIHESDVVPGLSNQVASKWAKKIFVSFPKTEYFEPEDVTLVGNPIRKEILEGDAKRAGELFDLSFTKPVFLVMGGSQGAETINDFLLVILNDLLKDYEIVHITGRENIKETEGEAQVVVSKDLEKYYHPVGFLDEGKMKHVYKAADFIISRSGAGSIFEIAAVGKPSILIPLPSSAGDHQAKNAYVYADTGAAIVIEQENLTQNFIKEKLQVLFLHPEKLEEMKQAALAFAKPLAARAIAREILEFLMLE
jgi:UDP-N-acetylglucosamine--N-acetylmuramyl-(pentapeptide) pyrophosphoryl-undecaprenol N-acetylglucosamine transferase